MAVPHATLTPASQQALHEARLMLEMSVGFLYLPVLVQNAEVGAQALALLRPALLTEPHRVAWPLRAHPQHPEHARQLPQQIQDDLLTMLYQLDMAVHTLPLHSTLLLDASQFTHPALARYLPTFLNQRREEWRRYQHRMVFLWLESEREHLMQGAPDLWSVRVASPWVEQVPANG
jgi:hypothetical protein